MIEINLLPEELRVRSKAKKGALAIEAKYFIYLIPVVIGLLLLVHTCLFAVIMIKKGEFYILNNKWKALESQRRDLESFKSEFAVITQDSKAIEQLVAKRVNWAEKLNKLSASVPSGVWFNEFTLSKNNFLLHGSVVSLQRQEMNLIKTFMDNLKKEASFVRDFANLELGSVQRRSVGGYEIVDFSLSGSLKAK